MTQNALYATSRLAVDGSLPSRDWLRDPSVTYLRLRGLASMAMALDPSLGTCLRFIQRAPLDARERLGVPYALVFTRDARPRLPHGVIEDESPVPFWEGMERVMGPAVAAAERAMVDAMPRQRFAAAEDAALYSAYKDGRIDIHHRRVNDEQMVATSDAIIPRPDEFMLHADLARMVYLTPVPDEVAAGPRDPGRVGVRHTRQLIQRIRGVLAQSFEESSSADRLGVVRAIAQLDGPRAAHGAQSTFEATQSHGWAGYALASGQGEWVPFLLAKSATSPHVPYGQHRPLELAIAQNHAGAVAALVQAGVSPNVALRGWPEVYDAASQRSLANLTDMFVPPLVFAAAVGAAAAAGSLLRAGASPDFATEHGVSPLGMAASIGDDAMVRLLLRHGANPLQPDVLGAIPAEKVPAMPEFNSLFELLEAAGFRARLPQGASPPPPEPGPVENPIPSMWEEPSRRRGMRPR